MTVSCGFEYVCAVCVCVNVLYATQCTHAQSNMTYIDTDTVHPCGFYPVCVRVCECFSSGCAHVCVFVCVYRNLMHITGIRRACRGYSMCKYSDSQPLRYSATSYLYQDTGNHHALRLCTLVAFQLLGINHYCACM